MRPVARMVDDVNDRERERERQEHDETIARAHVATRRAEIVAARIRRMNDIYRERLEGTRDRR